MKGDDDLRLALVGLGSFALSFTVSALVLYAVMA